ncbi:MAG TPA: MltA domain-containing protein [Geothermobacteraceae bacterium]|nr:MltA domain-containing protein [Geothermobacteraceae bacterium]
MNDIRLMFHVHRCALLLIVFLIPACIKAPPAPEAPAEPARQVFWAELPGWRNDNPIDAMLAFRQGCQALKWRHGWEAACAAGAEIDVADPLAVRDYFETWFIPWILQQEDGSEEGLLTGYYVPDLNASRTRTDVYRYPVYGVPDDLLIVDLSKVYPELGDYRLRGRLDGRRVIPYYDRAEIDAGLADVADKELFWVADPVELFFLHIQGSGRMRLPNGENIMVNYAEQNGHPYRSIGKLLLERGVMTRAQMSMQNIRAWARDNPDQVDQLLAENPSYVFFRELPVEMQSPPGAMGIPLTPRRSLAVDRRFVPLGAPVFLATTWPGDDLPLRQLMIAQDTGGAIKGRVRADFFWGMGTEAESYAGRMKQPVRLWVLLPRGVDPPANKQEKSRSDE